MHKYFIVWQEIMHIYQVLFSFPPKHKGWLYFLVFLPVGCCQRSGPGDMSRRYVWSLKVALTKKSAFTVTSFPISQLPGEFSKHLEQSQTTRWERLGLLNDLIRSCMTRGMSPGLGHEQYMNFVLSYWDYKFLFQSTLLHFTIISEHFFPSLPPFEVFELIIFLFISILIDKWL